MSLRHQAHQGWLGQKSLQESEGMASLTDVLLALQIGSGGAGERVVHINSVLSMVRMEHRPARKQSSHPTGCCVDWT